MAAKYDSAKLKAYIASLPKRADEAAEDTISRAQRYTQRRAPVLTGHLRDSIEEDDSLKGPGRRGLSVGAAYGAAVNYGHATRGGSHVPAQPFWEPGWEQVAAEMPEIARSHFAP